MSKLIVTADLHLTDKPSEVYRHQFMEELTQIVQKRKPDAVAILGDLTEGKDRHSALLVNKVVHHLDALASICPVVVMMGNHDYHNEGHPFFEFIAKVRNIAWVGRVATHEQLPKKIAPAFEGCLFLPHTRTYQNDWGAVTMRGRRWIFAHNTFTGADVGHGSLDGIPLDVFPKGARVVAGDIHVPQTIGPVTYVGAPYTVDFGDSYSPRLLALEADGRQHAIGVGSFPQKRLVAIDRPSDLLAATKRFNPGDILKVRVGVEDMSTWSKTHATIVDWCATHDLDAQRVEPVIAKHVVRKRHKLTSSQSDAELITQYAKRTGLTDHTLKVGLKLMEQE